MKAKHLQAAWEILAHIISGALLLFYIYAPNFRFLTWFLVIEYLIGVVNTVLWWTWLNSVDSTKQNHQAVTPPNPYLDSRQSVPAVVHERTGSFPAPETTRMKTLADIGPTPGSVHTIKSDRFPIVTVVCVKVPAMHRMDRYQFAPLDDNGIARETLHWDSVYRDEVLFSWRDIRSYFRDVDDAKSEEKNNQAVQPRERQ